MGAGASTAYLDDSWENLTKGEWRSARAKEMDKLGGASRVAVKRGQSMHYRLEWLKTQLQDQEEKIIAALAKGPQVGQEDDYKTQQKAEPNHARFSVKDWMNMRHHDIRTLAIDDKRKGDDGHHEDDQRQEWGTTGARSRVEKELLAKQRAHGARRKAYQFNLERQRQSREKGKPSASVRKVYGVESDHEGYAPWRQRIMAAKKTAWRTVGTLVRLTAGNSPIAHARRRRLARMDSYSIYFTHTLGEDRDIFVEEFLRYRASSKALHDLEQLMTELQRVRISNEAKGLSQDDELTVGPSRSMPVDKVAQEADNSVGASKSLPSILDESLPPARPQTSPGTSFSTAPLQPPSSSGLSAGLGPTSSGLVPGILPGKSSILAGAKGVPATAQRSRPISAMMAWRSPDSAGGPTGDVKMADAAAGVKAGPRAAARFRRLSASVETLPTRAMAEESPKSPQPPEMDILAGSAGRIRPPRSAFRRSSAPLMMPALTEEKPETQTTPRDGAKDEALFRLREQQLQQALDDEAKEMERPARMMTMYMNRSNARWVEKHQWTAPVLHDPSRLAQTAGGGPAASYKAEVLSLLTSGGIALQVFAADDYLVMRNGENRSMWSMDPWPMIASVLPARADAEGRLENLCMGVRQILGVVAGLELLVGKEGTKNLNIILHVNEDQEPNVMQVLRELNFCSLRPENIILVVERRYTGYTFDREQQSFQCVYSSARRSYGNGIALMQCSWPEEAFHLVAETLKPDSPKADHAESSPERSTKPRSAPGTVLIAEPLFDHLVKKGVKWTITRRVRDLSQYCPTSVWDVDALATMLFFHDSRGCAMTVQAELIQDNMAARLANGIILGKLPEGAEANATPDSVDVKYTDVLTAGMVQNLIDIRQKLKGKMLVSSKRYGYHVASMKGMLSSASLFHPSLEIHGDVVYLNFDMCDLTLLAKARCIALMTKSPIKVLASIKDADELAPAMLEQDKNPMFRKLAGSLACGNVRSPRAATSLIRRRYTTAADGAEAKPVPAAHAIVGQRVVVLVSDNTATALAVKLAVAIIQPGRDQLVLLTVAPTPTAEPAARALLTRFYTEAVQTLADVKMEVLAKDSGPLVAQLEQYVENSGTGLVVMGSMALAGVSTTGAMGSVALALMKTLRMPLLIVKATAKNASIQWDRDKLKVMVAVDHNTRPLLNYCATKLLNAGRRDGLVLARGFATSHPSLQDTQVSRRLLDNFSDIAASLHFVAAKRMLDGTFEECAMKVADVEAVHVVAVQAPLGRTAPASVLTLLKHCRSAVLVYKPSETTSPAVHHG